MVDFFLSCITCVRKLQNQIRKAYVRHFQVSSSWGICQFSNLHYSHFTSFPLALPLSCGLPDLPAFATSVNHTQMMEEKHRNTFELTCQTGFLLQGSKVLRCVDGNWIGSEAAQCIGM
jgi:hypothetical protein